MGKGKFRWGRSLSISILSLFLWNLATKPPAAQMDIRPDDTLGPENSIPVTQGDNTFIEGGASRGINLFHSFEEFNIDEGKAAYFTIDDAAIENIFSRITGNDPSDILGTLGTCISGDCSNAKPSASLYFVNPNGILFGPEASLDVGGSFIATTANAIEFGESGIYGTAPVEMISDLLTVNPSAFLFNQSIAQPLNSIESRANLSISESHSLLLVGGRLNPTEVSTGDIVIREGRLRSPGGNIEIGGITSVGKVGLNVDETAISVIQPDDVSGINFSMTGEANGVAELDVTSGGGGSINIYANDINISGGSDICAGIGPTPSCGSQSTNFGTAQSQAGNIFLEALGTVRIADTGTLLENDVNPNAVGNSGDIIINAESLILENGGQLSTSTYGTGNAGRIIANITGNISMSQEENNDTRIESNVIGVGNSGGVELSSNRLVLDNGAQIQSEVVGQGDSGDIKIQARESVLLTGNVLLSGGPAFVPSSIRTDLLGEGESGDIVISTGSLEITDRAQIISATSGKGDAGNVFVDASDDITLLNSIIIAEISERNVLVSDDDMPVNGGDIVLNADSLFLLNGSSLLADNEFFGRAGNILLNVDRNLVLQGRGPAAGDPNIIIPSQITAGIDSGGVGASGTIDITSDQLSLTNGGFISTDTSGQGNAGDISIRANNVRLRNGARISTNSSGVGNAGTLRVQADDLIELVGTDDESVNRTNMNANANANSTGRGGNLILESNRLILREGAGIAVASFGSGNAGNLEIKTSGDITVSGTSPDGAFSSRINSSSSFGDGEATGGEILISARNLSLDGGQIVSSSESAGNAGPITIALSDNLPLSDGDITSEAQQSSQLLVINDGFISTETFGQGDAGDINIRANGVRLRSGARISNNSSGAGNAGTLRVQADDLIELVGTDDEGLNRTNMNANANSTGRGGSLILESNRLIVREGAGIAVASFGSGNAGNLEIKTSGDITVSGTSPDGAFSSRINSSSSFVDGEATGGEILISARNLSLDEGRIVSRSRSAGNAGPINIALSEKLRLSDGDITSESQQSSGGSITIDARSAVLQEDSDIRTNSFGVDGGDVTLNIPVIVLLDDSDVLAFAPEGQGGNIEFNTLALLTNPLFKEDLQSLQNSEELEKLDGNETVDINASGAVSGQILGLPEITFLENSLTDLSADLSDSSELLANSCIAQISQSVGSFSLTGTNGLPVSPGNDQVVNYSVGDIRTIASDHTGLVEPQATYELADGRLVLLASCE